MRTVHLHVDRVMVDGLPAAEQRQFARALEARLRAWAASGAASQLADGGRVRISALDAGQLKPGATASQAAAQAAHFITRGASGAGNNARNSTRGNTRDRGGREARGHV